MRRNILLTIVSVLLLSSITTFAVEKVKIGIGEIKDETRLSESEKNRRATTGRKSEDDTRAFQSMLTTALIKTRKFHVIERARLAEILKEQGLSSETGLIEDGVNLGGITGVDYLLYGSITKLGIEAKGLGLGAYKMGSRKARMAVDIKIVDAQTGRAVIADSVEELVELGKQLEITGAFEQKSAEADPLADVMRTVANSSVKLIVSAIYPIKVVNVSGSGTVTLNYGKGLIEEGGVYRVFLTGKEIIDPDTKEVLGSEEKEIGMIEITSVQAKFSKAKIITDEGGNKMKPDDIETGAICRPVDKAKVEAKKKAERRSERKKIEF